MYKAIVSGCMYMHTVYGKDVEILSQVDNDDHTDIFCDITNALMDEINIPDGEDEYYFMAIVESEHVVHEHWEGREYDIEYYVTEIKSIADLNP